MPEWDKDLLHGHVVALFLQHLLVEHIAMLRATIHLFCHLESWYATLDNLLLSPKVAFECQKSTSDTLPLYSCK